MLRHIIFALLVFVGLTSSAITLVSKCHVVDTKTFKDTTVECYVSFDTTNNRIKVTYPRASSLAITDIRSIYSGTLTLSARGTDNNNYIIIFKDFSDFVGFPLMQLSIVQEPEIKTKFNYYYNFHPNDVIPICNKFINNLDF